MQSLQDIQDTILQIQSVEMESFDSFGNHFLAHGGAELHTKGFDCFVIICDWLNDTPNVLRDSGPTIGSHSLEGGIVLDWHHP
jgi:hypothetical protein